ncbi:MAG: COX15/CtaA family protein [Cyclobacteriaceae bacterium]
MANKNFFFKVNNITLGSVLVLILVGSIVRSMGAGMGCPDWPKCFGSYVPPTSSEQLPSNYLEVFKAERLSKNLRLSKLFSKLGFGAIADKIATDPVVLQEQEFNVTKAWIEYVNRLVGVLIGFLVFLNMIFAFSVGKRWVTVVGVFVFILTGFQGWVGSLVVSTNLLKGFITFHMLLALLIVALLIWMQVRAREMHKVQSKNLFIATLILFILFTPQIILGTEVRHIIDGLLLGEPDRANWFDNLSSVFLFHRSYSWLIAIGTIAVFLLVIKSNASQLRSAATLLLILVLLTMVVGVIMTNFSFPFWPQPLHLLFATGIFSILFYFILRLKIS